MCSVLNIIPAKSWSSAGRGLKPGVHGEKLLQEVRYFTVSPTIIGADENFEAQGT